MPRKLYRYLSRPYLLHAGMWALFIGYELVFVQVLSHRAFHWPSELLYYCLAIVLFYLHAHLTIPLGLRAQRLWQKSIALFGFTLLELACYATLMLSVRLLMQSISITTLTLNWLTLVLPHLLWRGLYFLLFSTAYYFIKRSFDHQKRETHLLLQLERSKNETLRAQINPHVLFNTLNLVHSRLEEQPQEATKAIELLSDLMDYALSPADEDGLIPLHTEIDHIHTLLELQRLRFGSFYLALDILATSQSAKVPPLLFITFVENMLKHGDLSDAQNPAKLTLHQEGQNLYFFSQNTIPTGSRKSKSHGLGLINISSRLNKLYPKSDYSLEITSENNNFTVQLKITLTNGPVYDYRR